MEEETLLKLEKNVCVPAVTPFSINDILNKKKIHVAATVAANQQGDEQEKALDMSKNKGKLVRTYLFGFQNTF